MPATAASIALIPERPPPNAVEGAWPWLKRNLFAGWRNTLATLIVLAILAVYVPPIFRWAVLDAVARYPADLTLAPPNIFVIEVTAVAGPGLLAGRKLQAVALLTGLAAAPFRIMELSW